jgi:plastocyanin
VRTLGREALVAGTSVAWLLYAALASPALAGTVRGRVELVQKGSRKADLTEVVVFLDGTRVKPKPGRATIAMKGKTFMPRVQAVGVGSTVEFPNDDPIFHNVFSVSGENRFDLDLYKRPKSGQWTFQNPGIVRVYCNIHPQMSAVVVVRDNPFFVKAGPDGSFEIADVPAGRYVLKAWHERASQDASQTVTVPETGEIQGRLVVDTSNYRRIQHKKKDGKDYGSGEKY